MTLPFYIEMADLLLEMLGEFGVDFAVTRTDPTNGAVTNFTIRGILVDPVSYRLHPVELNPVDKKFICDNKSMIQDSDAVVVNGQRYILTRVDPIRPADYTLGYKAEMRIG